MADGARNDAAVEDPNSGGTTPLELEIASEERLNPYDLKSRVDLRGKETKQEPIISGFDGRSRQT